MEIEKPVRFTVELLRRGVARLLREAPDAIRAAKIDALLVDQADLPAAASYTIESKVARPIRPPASRPPVD